MTSISSPQRVQFSQTFFLTHFSLPFLTDEEINFPNLNRKNQPCLPLHEHLHDGKTQQQQKKRFQNKYKKISWKMVKFSIESELN